MPLGQLSEICLGLVLLALAAAVVLHRYRRMPKPEELLASMHPIDLSKLFPLRDSFFGSQVSMEELKEIWHSASRLVNIFTTINIPGMSAEEHAYLRKCFLGITVRATWAIVSTALFRSYPLFAPSAAAAIYVQMWQFAKTLAFEHRRDLIPALDRLELV